MDQEVREILDSVREFQEDRELTEEEAKALDAALARPPVKVDARPLPSRRDK
jgi:hypothetical protein